MNKICHSRLIELVLLLVLICGCASPPESTATSTNLPTLVPSETFTQIPTLPPTLTPLPTSLEPTESPAHQYSSVGLSPDDNEAYQKAIHDIPIYRQGNLELDLQDRDGNPLSGYLVRFNQVSHDFLFGGFADPYYSGKLTEAGINSMTMYLAWNWLQPEYGDFSLDFANYWLGVDELNSGDFTLRSNAFYVPSNEDMPPFYKNVPFAEFLQRLYEHESTAVKRFGPSVDYWEAILEPNFGNHNPLNLTKDEYYLAIETSIKAIRDNDPDAIIELNLSYPCGGIDWLNNFQIVQEMLDRNIDFDVLGLQFYYNAFIGAGDYQMARMKLSEMNSCVDRYEELLLPFGKKVVGGEISVPSEAPSGQLGYWGIPWSEDTQAQYLVTAYTIFFSKPSNLGLIWWNTLDPSSFVYNGGLVKEDGMPKKAFYALQDLINTWSTNGEGISDDDGKIEFRGFAGDYEIEIINPENGEKMITNVHVTEQESNIKVIQFSPYNLLEKKKLNLERLIEYWEMKLDQERAHKGEDYLALIDHHLLHQEWTLADQTLSAALDELAIVIRVVVPPEDLIPVGHLGGGYTWEGGSQLIWGSTTLHLPFDFPEGTVTVEITAHSQNEKGESPIMVSGVGSHYSPVWKVDNTQSEIYSYSVDTTGNEQDFTVRFPYDGRINERINALGGDVGGLKLFIDQVEFTITTTEIPQTSQTPRATLTPSSANLIPNWEFNVDDDSEGWGVTEWDLGGIGSFFVENGLMVMEAIGNDPMVYCHNLSLDSDHIAKIEILMRASAGKEFMLYFETQEGEMNENRSFSFNVHPGDEFELYTINTAVNPYWKGIITELRFDPDSVLSTIEVDYIRLVESP